jgi:ATP-dependent DNA helicase RecG
MFGKAWHITDEYPNYFLDCRRKETERRWDDRITSDDGDWSGNVYDFYRKASIILAEGFPIPFELDSSMRRIGDAPLHKALREGLVNSLVHADYYGHTGVVASRFTDSVTFSNPGTLRLPLDVVEGGGVSDPRNPTLFKLFNIVGLGEESP